jgi:exodeoxyribonuclease-5
MKLSSDQFAALDHIHNWLHVNGPGSLLTLGGLAGTGKTTILKELCEIPNLSIAFVSLTGKATSVMRSKLPPGAAVSTIHGLIYRPVINPETGLIESWIRLEMAAKGRYPEEGQIPYYDLIVIDEASMVGEDLFRDLSSFGRPILAVGDHGQLPPIGKGINLMSSPDIKLETIHRQALHNPIIKLALDARLDGYVKRGTYSSTVRVMSIDDMDEEIEALFISPNADTLIITGSNSDRVAINNSVLENKGRTGDLTRPKEGDRIICLKNHNQLGLYNGMLCTLGEVKEEYSSYIRAVVIPDGVYPIEINIALWSFGTAKPTYPGPGQRGIPFDFGYCLTCHKAQGSEAKRVFVVGTGFGTDDDKKRWLYTAITRARSELYVIQ